MASVKAALQLAENGFFVKELNVGWKEWQRERLPAHKGSVSEWEMRCTCSKGMDTCCPDEEIVRAQI